MPANLQVKPNLKIRTLILRVMLSLNLGGLFGSALNGDLRTLELLSSLYEIPFAI